MYCSACGKAVPRGARFCQACGMAVGAHTPEPAASSRPMAGIVVASILGLVGLVWSGAVMFRGIYGEPSRAEAALYQLCPALQSIGACSNAAGLVGSICLLVGALLSLSHHPHGNAVVRRTCDCMLVAAPIFAILCLFMTVQSP